MLPRLSPNSTRISLSSLISKGSHPQRGWTKSCALAIAVLLAGFGTRSLQALDYLDNNSLRRTLRELADQKRDLIQLDTLTKSSGGQDVWQVEIGQGTSEERARRPALLVLAGIEGDDLAGTSSVVHWLNKLVSQHKSDTNLQQILAQTTIYAFPRVNPDSAASFFARPQLASAANLEPVDEDHDGLTDEDPPEDINGDGLITSMRIQDPEGEFIIDPGDARLMLRADRLKGEAGAWRVLSEGKDNDGDEAWNEDGPGGVNLNRNFPYNYRYFASWAGRHPMSQPETRALAEFVIAHPNIAIAFTFGATDNLTQTPKSEAARRPPATIHPDDIGYYREIGKAYRDQLGLKKELSATSEPGAFADWIYFHRGRLSLGAPAWSPALQLQRPKPTPEPEEKKEEDKESKPDEKPEEKKKGEGDQPADKRNEEERKFLAWLDEHAPESFVPWRSFDHPDFPEQKVEIGGYSSYARTLPPPALLEELANQHAAFLSSLPARLPRIKLRRAKIKALGNDIYDLTVEIENTGFLPTTLVQGALTDEVHGTRLVVELDPQNFLSGTRRTLVSPIPGSGGSRELRFVIHAPDRATLNLEVTSMIAGSFQHTLQLPRP